jgi:hypothetical protein
MLKSPILICQTQYSSSIFEWNYLQLSFFLHIPVNIFRGSIWIINVYNLTKIHIDWILWPSQIHKLKSNLQCNNIWRGGHVRIGQKASLLFSHHVKMWAEVAVWNSDEGSLTLLALSSQTYSSQDYRK